jgi:hypothetical protein
VIVDLEAGTFQHGALLIPIVQESATHITAAYGGPDQPGAFVSVLEKSTGRFSQTSSGLVCADASCQTQHPAAFARTGTCR